ncbi:unnamed protein product [Lampetra planeri]
MGQVLGQVLGQVMGQVLGQVLEQVLGQVVGQVLGQSMKLLFFQRKTKTRLLIGEFERRSKDGGEEQSYWLGHNPGQQDAGQKAVGGASDWVGGASG